MNDAVMLIKITHWWQFGTLVSVIVCVWVVVASCASSVHADEDKAATDAAYCVGILKKSVEHWKKINDPSGQLVSAIDEAVQKQSQKRALIESAIKQRKIDLVTATEMISAGFSDAKLCDEKIIKCREGYGERSERNVVDISNKAEFANCIKNAAPICAKQFNACQ